MRYMYPCQIVRDEEEERATGREAYVVTFPDVYGATTGGWSWNEAVRNAEDALVAALGAYYSEGEDIPLPGPIAKGQVPIPLRPVVAAKVALNRTMREQGITKVALGRKLSITESAVRKLCNPDHHSDISTVERALRAVGLCLVVETAPLMRESVVG